MQYYDFKETALEEALTLGLQKEIGLPYKPYCAQCSPLLKEQIAFDMMEGVTITAPGFYAPQGRSIRLPLKFPDMIKKMNYFHHEGLWLTNFEMETAGYYSMARLMGHEVLSVNAIIANRITNQFSRNPEKVIDSLIQKVLSRI